MRFFDNHSRRAFTLIELLISIAIVGILAGMMFTNFSKEKARNELKEGVQKIQADLKAQQTNAQAGVKVGSGIPSQYSVNLTTGSNTYTLTGDATVIRTVSLSPKVPINHFATSSTTLSINFASPNGKASFTGSSLAKETVTLKHATLNLCYAFDITANVGTVTVRSIGSCQ
jgi:prepilin-type N-terminal cleavage/methylation domain-containing protein